MLTCSNLHKSPSPISTKANTLVDKYGWRLTKQANSAWVANIDLIESIVKNHPTFRDAIVGEISFEKHLQHLAAICVEEQLQNGDSVKFPVTMDKDFVEGKLLENRAIMLFALDKCKQQVESDRAKARLEKCPSPSTSDSKRSNGGDA